MKKLINILVIIFILSQIITANIMTVSAVDTSLSVDLTNLKYTTTEITNGDITTYTQEQFNDFKTAFSNGTLPEVYITEFLYDGVGMVKTLDLDDFITAGSNDTSISTLNIKTININTTGNIQLSGEISDAMIAVNTNGITGDINLILNGVNIDTNSKKAPAIYVYNKDINYTEHKVTIKTVSGTKNYLEGGKFKKVSLMGSDELNNYINYYSGTAQTNYTTYTNYYGVYTSAEINNILFAKVKADNEDLADGDPYYFYKGAGAISSDIDLTFEGEGYLSVKSKNKEGIETKGNLNFSGGKGDYYIYAEDDCLNTTTSSQQNSSVRNTLTIDVNSLTAVVDNTENDGDEGDAIDSNGTLIINGGTILSVAHSGQDCGLDSVNGIYINGGTVLATGDMYDQISNQSNQSFMAFNFNNGQITKDTLITMLNSSGNPIMSYKTDRAYTNLVYSSPNIQNGATYTLYKDGTISQSRPDYALYNEESTTYGLYNNVTDYTAGTQLQYSSTSQKQGPGGQPGMPGTNEQTSPDERQPGTTPLDGNEPSNGTPDNSPNNQFQSGQTNNQSNNSSSSDFKVNDIANVYYNVNDGTDSSNTSTSASIDNTTSNIVLPNTGLNTIIILVVLLLVTLGIYSYSKYNNIDK